MLAFVSFEKLWRSEFFDNVSAEDRVRDKNLNQLKFKVNDTYKFYGITTTNFETVDDQDFKNKAFVDAKLSKN